MSVDTLEKSPAKSKGRKKASSSEPLESAEPVASARKAKLLLISSAKGGSGKTSISINMAVCAVAAGLSILLVDADPQQTLTLSMSRRPEEAPPIPIRTIAMNDLAGALPQIRAENVDLVIVDTPPGVETYKDAIRTLLAAADFVLVPTRSGNPDLDSVTEWMKLVKREDVPSAFVLNATKRSAKRTERARIRLIRAGKICPIDIRNLEDIEKCHDAGVGLIEISRATGIEDIEIVWEFVRGELGI
jgi:chromosome partitioning protein